MFYFSTQVYESYFLDIRTKVHKVYMLELLGTIQRTRCCNALLNMFKFSAMR